MKKRKENKHPQWSTAKKERVSYYVGDNAKSMEGQLVQIFMTTFLMLSGVNLVLVAAVTLIVKIIDSVDDVIFGYIIDRLHLPKGKLLSRLAGDGKYLPWYRLTFWMFPLITVLLFQMPQNASDLVKIIYFAIFYLLYDLTFTIVDIPMNSAVMTITSNLEERNAIVTNKTLITALVVIIAVPLMNFLISEFVGMSIPTVAILMSIIFVSMMLPMVFVTKEHNAAGNAAEDEEKKYTLREMLGSLKNNKFLVALFLSNIVYGCIRSTNAISLFASYYLYGNSQLLVIPTLLVTVPMLIAQKYAETLCNKFEKYKVAFVAQSVHFVLRLLVFLVGYKHVVLHIILLVTTAIPSIIHSMAVQYMLLDSIEYGQYKSGKECTAVSFALNSFISKVTESVSSSLCLLVLGLYGWITIQAESFAEIAEKNIIQPASAITGLWNVYAGFWVVGTGLCLVCLAFYRLKNSDARLMAMSNGGQISHAEADQKMSKAY